jgi:hypothetical protein
MIQNKLRYLVLLTSMGLLSILYNQYVMGIIFLTILVMPFILFAILSFSYGMVTAELVSTVHVAGKGQIIPISVQLKNPTIFPVANLTIYLRYRNAYSKKIYKKEYTISLDKRINTTIVCNLQSEFSGNLEISITGIRLYDYLKIFSMKKKTKGSIKIAVLPRFHEIMENDITGHSSQIVESDYYSSFKSGDDPSEVFAIREYKEGDRPQRIHWKLSMKQDQLMIKDFSDPLNCSILIFADLRVPEKAEALVYMDAILECTLSLSSHLISNKQIHYLAWYDEAHASCRRIRIGQEKDLFEAVDGLLQAPVSTQMADATAIYLAEHPNDQYTELFYVTGEVSSIRLDSLSLLKAHSKHILQVYSSGYGSEEAMAETYTEDILTQNFTRTAGEMGVGITRINIRDIKNNMEQLNFS